MKFGRKVRLAWIVLISDGPSAFVRRLLSNVRALGRSGSTPDECDIVCRAVNPATREGVMIDVGAHHGSAMDAFARADWRILAFEPDLRNRDRLSRLYAAFPNVTIDPRAVSDRAEDGVRFFASEQSSGISGLLAFDQSHREAGEITTTTLGQAISEYSLEQVDFLKIDAERLDLLVLQGLPDHIRPEVIVCEFEDRKTGRLDYDHADLADELRRRGYIVIMSEWYPIDTYGGRHAWRRAVRWPAELFDANGWGNFIAVQREELAEQILRSFPDKRS